MIARIRAGPPGMKGRAMTRRESPRSCTGSRTTLPFCSFNVLPGLSALLSRFGRRVGRLDESGRLLLVLVQRVLLFGLVFGLWRLIAHESTSLVRVSHDDRRST